jgi:hypothetical protein
MSKVKRPPQKPPTTGTCFSAYLLPHLLFVPDFVTRRTIVQTGCLAWNISLFTSAAEREERINNVWQLIDSDTLEAPPPGLEQNYRLNLRRLLEKKADLFPWLNVTLLEADLKPGKRHDILSIKADKGIEEIQLVTWPDAAGLPRIMAALSRMHEDTAAQVELLQEAVELPDVISDIMATQLVTMYSMQRADLVGYHRMLSRWHEEQPALSIKRVIHHWLRVLDDIEANTQTVLSLLESVADNVSPPRWNASPTG